MTRCIRCGETRPDSDFYAHPMMSSGHLNKCKDCCKTQAKSYREAEHMVQARALRKALARDGRLNREERAVRSRVANAERVKRWQASHREEMRANVARWETRHAEEISLARALKRDGRLNPEEQAVKTRGRKIQDRKEWAVRHPDRALAHARRQCMVRYARKLGAEGRATKKQIEARWAFYGGRCWLCGAPASETDHVLPLSRGGSDWASNQRPVCTPCNRSKAAIVMDLSEIAVFTRLALTA